METAQVLCPVAFTKESDLARLVVQFLHDEQWEVYQEVEPHQGGGSADIVAVRGPVVWVIECKLSLSIDLIGQALSWKGYAHRISVAIPARKNRSSKRDIFINTVLRDHGIGWLEVHDREWSPKVREYLRPGFSRRLKDSRIRKSLTEMHKTFAEAGNDEGRRWTPFKHTCHQIVSLVQSRPGITLKEIIDSVNHHYGSDSSARSSISHWIREGVIKGIESRRDGKHLRFYPAKESS